MLASPKLPCSVRFLSSSRGLLPFAEREQLIVYNQQRTKAAQPPGPPQIEAIVKGSQVSLRSRPIYPIGCKVLRVRDNQVVCGELVESIFSMSGVCEVRVLPRTNEERMEVVPLGNEPSTSGGSLLGTKRPHADDDESSVHESRRESWPLREVAILAPPLINLYSGEWCNSFWANDTIFLLCTCLQVLW